MVVRPITPKELQAARNISTLAFAEVRDPNTKPEDRPDAHAGTRAAFDDTGKMTACLQIVPYTVRLGAHRVALGGIGGVASLPETRRQGNTRALMLHSLREMRERGMLLSALYPFSHRYYRQYGYELVCTARRTTAKMSSFAAFPVTGTARQYLPGEDDQALRRIYEAFTARCNLAPRRDDALWKKWLEKDPYTQRQYTYVWHNEANEARAYAVLRVADRPEGRELQVADAAYGDAPALVGLLGLLRNMGEQYATVSWELPLKVDPNAFFPEPYEATQIIVQKGMARVLDVSGVLERLSYSGAPGEYTLRIIDPQLPENDGPWRVTFADGQARAAKLTDEAVPVDWTLDIPAFTQLALGYLDVDTLLWSRPGTERPQNLDTLRRVFVKREVYMPEYF